MSIPRIDGALIPADDWPVIATRQRPALVRIDNIHRQQMKKNKQKRDEAHAAFIRAKIRVLVAERTDNDALHEFDAECNACYNEEARLLAKEDEIIRTYVDAFVDPLFFAEPPESNHGSDGSRREEEEHGDVLQTDGGESA